MRRSIEVLEREYPKLTKRLKAKMHEVFKDSPETIAKAYIEYAKSLPQQPQDCTVIKDCYRIGQLHIKGKIGPRNIDKGLGFLIKGIKLPVRTIIDAFFRDKCQQESARLSRDEPGYRASVFDTGSFRYSVFNMKPSPCDSLLDSGSFVLVEEAKESSSDHVKQSIGTQTINESDTVISPPGEVYTGLLQAGVREVYRGSDQQMLVALRASLDRTCKVRHDNLLACYGVNDRLDGRVRIIEVIMELMPSNLIKSLERLKTKREKLLIARCVAAGLQHLHSQEIVHGNLSPTQILVTLQGNGAPSEVKLANYGLWENRDIEDRIRSWEYAAPEIVLDTSTKSSKASDVWSFGMLLHYIFTGAHPWTPTRSDLQKLFRDEVKYTERHQLSGTQEIDNLIIDCAKHNPSARVNAESIFERLTQLTL